jgi:post-segregation antitoxin (ccd killing protein)
MTAPWPNSIRESAYRLDAPRQTVSLTINSDLFAKAKAEGVNVSRVAEEALAQVLDRLRRAHIETEVRGALDAVAAFEQEHGSFPEQMREQFGDPWAPGK